MTTATQPGIEPETPTFQAIALPVKLLGQVRLRPNHGATLSPVLSNNIFATTPTFPSLGGFYWVGRPGTSVDSVENVGQWHSFGWRGREWLVTWSESDLAQ